MNVPRKMITASIAGTLFALLLALVFPNPFGTEEMVSLQDYLFSAILSASIYMLYSIPVILIYGVLTSLISDKVGEMVQYKMGGEKTELVVSGILHALFGFILLWFSLSAAILFFITDRLLKKRKDNYEWLDGIKSLTFPIVSWLIIMAIIWGKEIIISFNT